MSLSHAYALAEQMFNTHLGTIITITVAAVAVLFTTQAVAGGDTENMTKRDDLKVLAKLYTNAGCSDPNPYSVHVSPNNPNGCQNLFPQELFGYYMLVNPAKIFTGGDCGQEVRRPPLNKCMQVDHGYVTGFKDKW